MDKATCTLQERVLLSKLISLTCIDLVQYGENAETRLHPQCTALQLLNAGMRLTMEPRLEVDPCSMGSIALSRNRGSNERERPCKHHQLNIV